MNNSVSLKISRTLLTVVSIIFVLVPFYAFVTVWASSFTGHYTAWRLLDEILLLIGMAVSIGVITHNKSLGRILSKKPIFRLIYIYVLIEFITGLVALKIHNVNTKALGYGLIVNLRYPLFFIVCFVVASQTSWIKRNWQTLILIPAAIVVLFGLLQHFVLPYDFLSHFGYSSNTIPAYETINSNIHYIRIISTLRGANPLGAYLIIPIASLTVLIIRAKNSKTRIYLGIFLLACLYVLYLSFSRSAWAGAGLSILIVIIVALPKYIRKWLILGVAILIIVFGVAYVLLRNNVRFENIIFHTNRFSTIQSTSDQGHESALEKSLSGLVHQPLGLGPGTAGPASVYNNHPARIAENYFVQVAQEVGWLGLIIFLLINWLVGRDLWINRADTLALALFAALLGISFVNLLSHAWTDDTLSYIWWGLAGIAFSPVFKNKHGHDNN